MPARLQTASLSPTLLLTAAALLAPATPVIRAQLPATPPTSATPATTAPLAATSAVTTTSRPQRAQVSYTGGELDVRAENSSLNDILYEISHATGMKISGGVSDQRVFGHYGPAAPSDVLATLLDGTGTNMLLRENGGEGPVELVLTPRTGGPTPPSPAQPSYPVESSTPPQQPPAEPAMLGPGRPRPLPTRRERPRMPDVVANPQSATEPQNNPLGSPDNTTNTVSTMPTTDSVPSENLPTPTTTTETQQGIVDSPNPPPAGSTTSSSPNDVSTPEQIYQQLLKLQQQQNGSGSSSSSGSSTPTVTPATTTTPPQ